MLIAEDAIKTVFEETKLFWNAHFKTIIENKEQNKLEAMSEEKRNYYITLANYAVVRML